MAERLFVDLYDRVTDPQPQVRGVNDEDDGPFFDLNTRNFADKAARVMIRQGPDYRVGDHVQFLDKAQPHNTNVVCVDPDITPNGDANLNDVLNSGNFADRAAALAFVLNPNADGAFRLRVRLYDTLQQADELPSLVLYDWQADGNQVVDLQPFFFVRKAAKVGVDMMPGVEAGPHVGVFLQEILNVDSGNPIAPSRAVDLTPLGTFKKVVAVHFWT